MKTTYIQKARQILLAEAKAIEEIPLDEHFSHAVSLLVACKGKIITTGMGKAGHIAQKTAGTLSSTGSPSVYIHPGESAHGDLGILCDGDIILAFSTSGKTREVLEMIDRAQHFCDVQAIAITSHTDAPLRRLCATVINMGIIVEPCSLGLTPTASTTVMAALGDALALCVMEEKNFTKADYGIRHHGGYLGMKARGADSL